jgi:glyoxylase-like metal-dependent hydrolase (beta-lactamase superfamily II)
MKTRWLLPLSLGLGISSLAPAAWSFEDSWSTSFKNYAQQISDPALRSSIEHYAQEYERLVVQQGYIGNVLSIPAIERVADGVFFVKGALMWGTLENFGLNNNITAVELDSGVFVYNTGSNPAVAYSFHQKLKRHTSKPVKWLAAENYQSHANLGGSYWYAQGVRELYSQTQAAKYWTEEGYERAVQRVRQYGPFLIESVRNVSQHYKTFDEHKILNPNTADEIHLINFGGGHTPTMTGAFIPSKNLLFTGDLGFVERIPGLLHGSSYSAWLQSFDAMQRYVEQHSSDMDSLLVIPGHGGATNFAQLKHETYDFFLDLEAQVKRAIAQGVVRDKLTESLDMSAYQHRPMYDQLRERNALSAYDELMSDKKTSSTR